MKDINHVQIIIRAEIVNAPDGNDGEKLNGKIDQLIKDINMNVLIPARNVWVDDEKDSGSTGIACLETSHVAYHFWNKPSERIMMYDTAKLLQMCLYTCGCLDAEQIKLILGFITEYEPLRVEAIVINREITLFDEPTQKILYDVRNGKTFEEFLKELE